MLAPRPNMRRPHPLDACQQIRPVEVFERDMLEDPPATRCVDWLRLWGWSLALTVTVTCWGLMLWVFL